MTAVLPAQRFRALADPTRLRLLGLLAGGECCVGDLVAVLDLPQGTVSRHLATLRRAGLVQVRRRGPWAYYRRDPSCQTRRALGRVLAEAVAAVPEAAADQRRLQSLRETGGCC